LLLRYLHLWLLLDEFLRLVLGIMLLGLKAGKDSDGEHVSETFLHTEPLINLI